MSLKAQLDKARALWKKGKEMKSKFESSTPDGVYAAKISKVELNESENTGRLQMAWTAIISGGEMKGETVRWWSGLKTEQNWFFAGRDLVRLGHEPPEDVNDFPKILTKISNEKPSVRIKLTTDGEYQNVRILKKLDSLDAPEDTVEPSDPEPEESETEPAPEEAPVEELPEEPAEEPEEADLEVGTRVAFDLSGEEVVGVVKAIDKDTQKVTVALDRGKKFAVKLEKLRPAPKVKVKKK